MEVTELAATTAANLVLGAEMPVTGDEPGVLAHARQGDADAFFTLFQAHASRIYGLSLSATRDVTAAENLTRNIFVEAFTCLGDIHDEAGFATSLNRRTAKNILAHWAKRRYPQGFGHRLESHPHLSFVGRGDLAIHPE